jgi:uncharacterized membrane protein
MFGITAFGMFHTVLGLIAVVAGFVAIARHFEIAMASRSGRLYVWLTVATCITGFFIFHHGGFGKPHVLGIVTLLVLALAWLAERGKPFGRFSHYVAAIGYTLTLFFHMIPGFTETLIRLPEGRPWASGPDDPQLAQLIGGVFVAYLGLMVWQGLRIRRERGRAAVARETVSTNHAGG